MTKLRICGLTALGLGILAVALRVCQTLFFVDGTDCLADVRSFSYYAFVAVLFIAALSGVFLLVFLKNRDFMQKDKTEYGIGFNIYPTAVSVASLALVIYTLWTGRGFFSFSVYSVIGFCVFTLLMLFCFGWQIFNGENFLKNKYSPAVMLVPVICYLFRLIMIFVYYTAHDRDFNFKEVIVANAMLLLFWLYFARHLATGNYAKNTFAFALLAIFFTSAAWLPAIISIRSVPAFGGDPLMLLANAVFDIASAVYALAAVRTFLLPANHRKKLSGGK